MNSTDQPLIDFRPDGQVVLLDDDGDPHHHLAATDAILIAEQILDRRTELEQASQRTTVRTAMTTIAGLLADTELPQPKGVATYFGLHDLTVDVDLRTDSDLLVWAARLGCPVSETRDSHPTLGHRLTARQGAIALVGPWDHQVTAPATAEASA